MSLDHPRRIFRSGSRAAPRRLGRTILVGLAGAFGCAAVVMMGLSGDLFGRNTPGPTGIAAAAADVAVIDGQTLRLGGTVVRLSDLHAPARGQSCAAGPDCGSLATAMLASLVRDRDVACRVTGHGPHGASGRALRRRRPGRERRAGAAGWAQASDPVLARPSSGARTPPRRGHLAGCEQLTRHMLRARRLPCGPLAHNLP